MDLKSSLKGGFMLFKKIKLGDVSTEQAKFLSSVLALFFDYEGALPIYQLQANGQFAFIEDFKMPRKAFKKLEQEGPAGLYRGGAIIKVTSRYGVLVIPDERYQFFKPFAGIAHYREGHDLCLTGARELMEEAFVYSLDKKYRFVPAGRTDATKVCTLGFEVNHIVEIGEVKFLAYDVNEKNRALEAVFYWDISDIPVPFSVSLEEKWFSGGRSGINVFVIDPKSHDIVGLFSGQQGFQEIPKYEIHEVLARYL